MSRVLRWEEPTVHRLNPIVDELETHPDMWGVIWERGCGEEMYSGGSAYVACMRHPRIEVMIEKRQIGDLSEEHFEVIRARARWIPDHEWYARGCKKPDRRASVVES